MLISSIMLLILVSVFFIVLSPNPVYSVIWLVIFFILVSCILLLLNLDFLALMMLIVYVGAIAILFLFVIMMLNIKLIEISFLNLKKQIPFGILLIIIFFFQIIFVSLNIFEFNKNLTILEQGSYFIFFNNYEFNTNTKVLGMLIYNNYWFFFILIGFALLLAMLGAVALTFKKRDVLRQEIYVQIVRDSKKQFLLKLN